MVIATSRKVKNKPVILSNLLEIWEDKSISKEEALLIIAQYTLNSIECYQSEGYGLYEYIMAELQEERLGRDCCPKCGELIVYDDVGEDSEHFGNPVQEKIYQKRCVSCGWEED